MEYGIPVSCAFAGVLSAALVPGVRAAAISAGLVDSPGPLKIHTRPIPRLGGAAFILAFLISAAPALRMQTALELPLAALLVVWITGLADDIRSLPPWLRLAVQAAAGLLVFGSGIEALPGAPSLLNAAATCGAVVASVNAFNFIDGSDGLAAGTAAIAAIGFAAVPGAGPAVSLAGATLASACAGFLLYNFPPARVFMGDSGSTAIGLVLAVCALHCGMRPPLAFARAAVPLLILGLPLADLAAAVFRRIRNGRSPFAGDRSHFYDVLLRRGWPPRAVALLTYLVQAALTAIALAIAPA